MSEGQEAAASGRVKVVDRRRYALDEQGELVSRPDAQPRDPEPETPTPAAPPPPPATPSVAPSAAQAPAGAGKAPALSAEEQAYAQKIFLEFLNGLAHSMLAQLGEVPDPGSGIVREDLEGARQTLEMLSVLRHKTEGNLTAQESRMFDSLLYELMMRFRQRVEGMAGARGPGGRPGPVPGDRP